MKPGLLVTAYFFSSAYWHISTETLPLQSNFAIDQTEEWQTCLPKLEGEIGNINRGVAEWSIAAVLKTVELRGSGGSNPSSSAKSPKYIKYAGLFLFWGRHR